jgi:hypothetical protein
MDQPTPFCDRRTTIRFRSDDVIRWKRPGRVEDHKGWTVDRSDRGIGFCTLAENCPRAGEVIHLRVLDGGQWITLDREVRVVRTVPTPGGELVFVGCACDGAEVVARNR